MVRIAVAQFDASLSEGPVAPLEVAIAAVGRAADAGCAVVILPEYASGWLPRLVPELAKNEDGPFLTGLRAAARERAIAVVAGTVVPTAEPGRAWNVTVVLGPDGALLGRYAKVHRYDAYGARESDLLDAGDPAAPLVVEVPVPDGRVRIGVVTCYDLRFPESFRALVDLAPGADPSRPARVPDLVAVGAAWAAGPDKAEQLRVLVRARAIENTTFVALASQGGRGRVGGSAIVGPRGEVLTAVDDGHDGGASSDLRLAVADLEVGTLEPVRAASPVLAHRRYRVVPATAGTAGVAGTE